ncbi:MAG: redox-regulated ATPase YchF [Planctomycetes bacterium]|nr:redox-regulated ATPase YchF [Planctomycetota bacterium]
MELGICGLPQSGKSTLFRAITGVGSAALVFSGARPSVEMVTLRDPRLERLRDDYRPKKFTPTQFKVLDFPGIDLSGSAKSRAELVANIREADALVVVLRAFTFPGLKPPDPVADLEALRSEFLLSDLAVAEKRVEKLTQQVKRMGSKAAKEDQRELEVLGKALAGLNEGRRVGDVIDPLEEEPLRGFRFFTQKPVVGVVNLAEGEAADGAIADRLAGQVTRLLAAPLKLELDLSELDGAERETFMKEMGVTTLARDALVRAAYEALGLLSFFTVGEDEVRAWTVRGGDHAVTAAGKIHSDIARGFIAAEVVAYDDYARLGGHKGAREKGRLRLEGRNYAVADGDIINFRFSV